MDGKPRFAQELLKLQPRVFIGTSDLVYKAKVKIWISCVSVEHLSIFLSRPLRNADEA